ncbi:MAG TPA: hypothetical protein VKZ52_11985 [Burkholderiaceae bacterium]|nr:hypothetical protein [Burkholderiaceae bacterium]
MNKQISAHGIKLAILGAALAAAGAAYASDAQPQPRFHDRAGHHAVHPGHPGFHHGHHGFHRAYDGHRAGMHHSRKGQWQRAGLIVPGYGVVSRDFVEGMGLNAEQLKLIEEARTAARDLRKDRKERVQAARQTRAERFKSDTFDPVQALKQAEERRAQLQAERRQIDEKWVAVWNALDTNQQARVTEHLKKKAERAEQRAQKRDERMKQREAARAARQENRAS